MSYDFEGDDDRDHDDGSLSSSSSLPSWSTAYESYFTIPTPHPNVQVFVLLAIASVALYAQSAVTDLRFLPALNVLCHVLSIPQDVAAATLMSAGAASPNLLAVLISMFVTHSSLGVGTIVGSEMFQGLACVAGAVWHARGGNGIALDPWTVGREVAFYALSLGLLLRMTGNTASSSSAGNGDGAVSAGEWDADEEEEDDDDGRNQDQDRQASEEVVVITAANSMLLLGLYAAYVVVCAAFDRIVAFAANVRARCCGVCCSPRTSATREEAMAMAATEVATKAELEEQANIGGGGGAGCHYLEMGSVAVAAAPEGGAVGDEENVISLSHCGRHPSSQAIAVEAAAGMDDAPFLKSLRREPRRNFHRGDTSLGGVGGNSGRQDEEGDGIVATSSSSSFPSPPPPSSPERREDGRAVIVTPFGTLEEEVDDGTMGGPPSPLAGRPRPRRYRLHRQNAHAKRRWIMRGKKTPAPAPERDTLRFLACADSGCALSDSNGATPAQPKPSQIHDLEDMELLYPPSHEGVDVDAAALSCFLWQRSVFYDRARIGRDAWQLRWFTFHPDGTVSSVPDRPLTNTSFYSLATASAMAPLSASASSIKFLEEEMILDEGGEDDVIVPGRLVYPRFGRVECDSAHLVMRLHGAGVYEDRSSSELEYVLMAPSGPIFAEVLRRIRAGLLLTCATPSQDDCVANDPAFATGTCPSRDGKKEEEEATKKGDVADACHPSLPPPLDKSPFSFEAEALEAEAEAATSFIDPLPPGASFSSRAVHCLLLPVKVALHTTIPDVRIAAARKAEAHRADASEPLWSALLSLGACSFWLMINSYVMVASLERVGRLLDVPDSVVGVTVSAVGTSISVYVASVAAARQGLGNMAISNAFASNTFNVAVGLGLPWTMYCLLVSEDGTYRGLGADDGISQSVAILAGSLILTVLMIVGGKFALKRWHACALGILYVAYLLYTVGRVFVLGLGNTDVEVVTTDEESAADAIEGEGRY